MSANNLVRSCCDTEIVSLFFTKATGDDHFKVYARYRNKPEWVLVAITDTASQGLQQVRDFNRNISINSGSYQDAHFYLRSADGNNMTTAFFTNAAGGGIQSGNATDFAPLNLQPDGGTLTYGGKEVATKEWVDEQLPAGGQVVSWGANTGNMYGGYPGNSVLSNSVWNGTPDAGSGFTWNAAENNVGGIYSAQMYIGVSAGPGAPLDNFFYRANQQGGPGWPTPWWRVASREWSNANLIQNQSSVTQAAGFKINGTGESTTTLAAPTVKANMIMPNSGSSVTFSGDVILSTVASNLLKVDVTGKIVGAIANSDYVEYVGENILSVNSSGTLSLAETFPTASTSACIIYCDTSSGNIILELPAVIGFAGKGPICFIKTDNSGNKVVIKGAGTTLINNSNVYELLTQFQKATIRGGDGAQYWLF